MIRLLIFAGFMWLYSCTGSSDKSEKKVDTVYVTVPSEQNISITDTVGPVSGEPPQKASESNPSVFPIGTYKTLPEIMKNVFSEGSTKTEVINVQGTPDLIERIDEWQEVWYYGNCEVRFRGQMVKSVLNPDKKIKYASWGVMIFSPDPIEVKFSSFLTDRMTR